MWTEIYSKRLSRKVSTHEPILMDIILGWLWKTVCPSAPKTDHPKPIGARSKISLRCNRSNSRLDTRQSLSPLLEKSRSQNRTRHDFSKHCGNGICKPTTPIIADACNKRYVQTIYRSRMCTQFLCHIQRPSPTFSHGSPLEHLMVCAS